MKEVTLENLEETINIIVNDKVKFTKETSTQIGEKIATMFADAIQSGQAQPALMETTIKAKRAKGYESPESPLFATGAYSQSLEDRLIDDTEIDIVTVSELSPSWHALRERTLSVLNKDEITSICQEVISANLR